ncbi:MAG: hypothetical protein QM820_09125 [Minicystis sp.]
MYEAPDSLLAVARDLGIEQRRFKQVGPGRVSPVLGKILETFTRHGAANETSLWLWEDFDEVDCVFVDPHAYRVIRQVAPPSTRVWFVTEDFGRRKRHGNYWLFEGELGAALDVVENHFHFEYYVVSRKIDWMIAVNHHDVVHGVGAWIGERLSAMEAAGLVPGRLGRERR